MLNIVGQTMILIANKFWYEKIQSYGKTENFQNKLISISLFCDLKFKNKILLRLFG